MTNPFSFKIHHTGSTGNSATVSVNDINFLIDFGKSYKTIKPYLEGVDFVFCTHVHSDHLNIAAYKGMLIDYPYLTVLTNQEVIDRLATKGATVPDNVIKAGDTLYVGDIEIHVFENEHGVECNGYIFTYQDHALLFATDLSTTMHYRDWLDEHQLKLDTILLEANYNPQVIQFYEESKAHTGFNIFSNGSYRHLPTTEHNEFISAYLKPDGVVKALHKSSTYFSFDGLKRKLGTNWNEEAYNEWKQHN